MRLRNSGSRRGREVIQVYLAREESSIERPARWLASFTAVELDPGQETVVEVDIPARAFAHRDVDAQAWAIEPGTFRIEAGRSAGDLRLAGKSAT